VLKSLLTRLGAARSVAIPGELWNETLASISFVARLGAEERERLRALAEQLLADKEMAGAGELELTAAMQVNIAVQACLPILNLGIEWYRGWTSIVVYPNEFLVPRSITDDDGVVHEYTEPISGEAWEGGPLLLSWDDAARAGATNESGAGAPYCVVIHEFTHKLDMLSGDADGCPPFDAKLHPTLDPARWRTVLNDAFERFNSELDLLEAELPADVDPESDDADRHFTHLPLDPYAAQEPGEFFAVSSETFFVAPAPLRDAFPDWYAQLALFFRQDPLVS